jgi:hypothetical protein
MDEQMPKLPDPTYIYHIADEQGADDLYEFATAGDVDIDVIYEGGVCPDCVRLYTADQVRAYAKEYAAAPSQPAAAEWQPIETAPKNGVFIVVLGCYPHSGAPETVRWFEDCWDAGGDGYAIGEPTHWMPLPAAPKATP